MGQFFRELTDISKLDKGQAVIKQVSQVTQASFCWFESNDFFPHPQASAAGKGKASFLESILSSSCQLVRK